ncbi:acylphosphatase [Vibrio mexicanus]|uniref:acylphosphatase n=1 Tax=Vibrio mexicanus TaxID=1004326 RepID=UPI00063C6EF8|nr:acylphosphatase [Vibrio mexicanus]
MTQMCDMFTVSGIVQGVGFRYFTAREGIRIGLKGYAKNLANGDVEVLAVGTKQQLDEIARWLEHGPRTATVESVDRQSHPVVDIEGFATQ